MKVLKVLYVLCMIFIGIGALGFFISALSTNEGIAILMALIFIPIFSLMALIYTRVMLESTALFFRIGQNTEYVRDVANAVSRPGGAPSAPGVPGAPSNGHPLPPQG